MSEIRKYFDDPSLPSLLSSVKEYIKLVKLIVGEAVLAVAISIIGWFIKVPIKTSYFVIGICVFFLLSLTSIAIIYIRSLRKYIKSLEASTRKLKNILLLDAKIDPSKFDNQELEITGITDMAGSVNLIIKRPIKNWLVETSKLDVLTRVNDECWGTVEVIGVDNSTVSCEPIDRINVIFWEKMEDRMKYDPTPPQGVFLEPNLPQYMRELIQQGKKR